MYTHEETSVHKTTDVSVGSDVGGEGFTARETPLKARSVCKVQIVGITCKLISSILQS